MALITLSFMPKQWLIAGCTSILSNVIMRLEKVTYKLGLELTL